MPGACMQLTQLTGLDGSTFQGDYRAPDRSFVVGPENPEWVAQRVLSDLRPLYLPAAASDRAAQQQSMRDLRFWAVLHSFPNIPGLPPEAARHQGLFTLAEFTIGGPVAGTTVALPRDVTGVATDPHGPTHYGLSREGVVRLDIQAGQVEQIAWDPAVGRPGWPLGITFDTKRGRVVVSTLDRGGRLYAYDVAGTSFASRRCILLRYGKSISRAAPGVSFGLLMPHRSPPSSSRQ